MVKKSLLVSDAFRAHQIPEMKIMLTEEFKTMPNIIPGGIALVLQPLGVAVNKLMKSIL